MGGSEETPPPRKRVHGGGVDTLSWFRMAFCHLELNCSCIWMGMLGEVKVKARIHEWCFVGMLGSLLHGMQAQPLHRGALSLLGGRVLLG
jgi:hypothetical protein